MEWDEKAVGEFIKLPLSDGAKSMAKVFAEKLARKNKSSKVTMKEIDGTKKVYFAQVTEDVRMKEFQKRIAEGETDLMQRMEKEAREILATDIDLFDVDLCHAQYFRCGSQIIEIRELKREIEKKLKELKLTEMIADMLHDDERILPHHRVGISVSACMNGCTGPEHRNFGVSGASRPVITDANCIECMACEERCPRNAIAVHDAKPVIDIAACDCCEACVKVCPNAVIVSEKKGYKIFVGGSTGRFHQPGHELFKLADKETLMKALESSIKTIKEQAVGEESLTHIINRVGVAPIYQKIYQS
jgi:dissimilatory sulfite reductase (desulfoviridin) alpha/beta subunit